MGILCGVIRSGIVMKLAAELQRVVFGSGSQWIQETNFNKLHRKHEHEKKNRRVWNCFTIVCHQLNSRRPGSELIHDSTSRSHFSKWFLRVKMKYDWNLPAFSAAVLHLLYFIRQKGRGVGNSTFFKVQDSGYFHHPRVTICCTASRKTWENSQDTLIFPSWVYVSAFPCEPNSLQKCPEELLRVPHFRAHCSWNYWWVNKVCLSA